MRGLISAFNKANESYLKLFQKIYDWLWDTAGVYLGTMMFGASIPMLLCDWSQASSMFHKAATVFWGFCLLSWCSRILWLQTKHRYEVHNAGVLVGQWLLKLFLWQFLFLFPLLDLLDGKYQIAAFHAATNFIFWGWPYCLMRKRQKKKQEQRVPANAVLEGA